MVHDDVIIRAAIEAHSEMQNQFTLRRSCFFRTKLVQWMLPGEL